MSHTRLPSPTEFQLLTLLATERTGREVAKAYEKSIGKSISYGTLYTTLRRMYDNGWVSVRDEDDADGRLKWFKIRAAGARAMDAAVAFHRRQIGFAAEGA